MQNPLIPDLYPLPPPHSHPSNQAAPVPLRPHLSMETRPFIYRATHIPILLTHSCKVAALPQRSTAVPARSHRGSGLFSSSSIPIPITYLYSARCLYRDYDLLWTCCTFLRLTRHASLRIGLYRTASTIHSPHRSTCSLTPKLHILLPLSQYVTQSRGDVPA